MQSGKAKCCTCDGISFDYLGNIDTHFTGTLELDNFPYHIALQKKHIDKVSNYCPLCILFVELSVFDNGYNGNI